VAERYPWLDAYTPVNEPNTTARFSGLYGLWYPHAMSRAHYLRALLNQLKGTVLSMRAIRRVQPEAQLIQTDDVGRIAGTLQLHDTWELLNLRQWLPFDLLCGRVNRAHPMFAYMGKAGIPERDVLWFEQNPCPPSIIGVNYYVTSDRYLDHRLYLYPRGRRSAEGRFVDVEAVRVRAARIGGAAPLLRDAWRRYGIPVAITEAHIGCSVEEQMRWLAEIWHHAMAVRREGVDCVAITPWALLGSFYWNQLVTRANGHYEPGVFRLIDGEPVDTALCEIVAQIGRGESPHHPSLAAPGWWRSDERICFPCGEELAEAAV
jgi:dTDP-4-dehydrorhamnose reductase